MRGKLKEEGKYELFKTTHGHDILNLEDKDFYALVSGQQGDLIIQSDADHKKQKTISKGKFFYVDFKNDPEFQDMKHIFLKDGSKYRELVLPEGLPTKSDHQKKLVRTKDKVTEKKVKEHVKGKGDKGSEKQYSGEKERLKTRTKDELYEMAKKKEIKGRSKMTKQELIKSLKE